MKDNPQNNPCFPATRWTLVRRLRSSDEAVSRPAIDELCSLYRFPLYCFIRRRGFDHHDAEDALHDFFAKLLRLNSLAAAAPDQGRLRSYLATALRRFLGDWKRRADQTRTPSGQIPPAAFHGEFLLRYEREATNPAETPERMLERQWARELLARTLDELRSRYASCGKLTLFEHLLPVLRAGGRLHRGQSAAIASQLGLSDGTVRVALSRLLADYREILRAAVLETVESHEQVRDEIHSLMTLFARD